MTTILMGVLLGLALGLIATLALIWLGDRLVPLERLKAENARLKLDIKRLMMTRFNLNLAPGAAAMDLDANPAPVAIGWKFMGLDDGRMVITPLPWCDEMAAAVENYDGMPSQLVVT